MPARANARAQASPAMPPPAMTTSVRSRDAADCTVAARSRWPRACDAPSQVPSWFSVSSRAQPAASTATPAASAARRLM
jgi:hypothetical protein